MIRIGLIGYGYWGPNYARVFSELPGASLVAICEARPHRLQEALAHFPHVDGCSDVASLLDRRDVDAVVISTPASTHFQLAQMVLSAGRDVLVEKPMAIRVDEAQRLCDLTERTGRVLMVGHTFLYNPGIVKMREYIRSSEFGRVYYLHATRTNLGPIREDVNAVWDLAPHDVAIMNFLLGQHPHWVSAVGSRVLANGRDDIGFATLGYADGVIANIHVSWVDPNKVREVVAIGSRQRVVFNDLNDLERIRIFEKGVSVGEAVATSYGEFKLLVRDGDILSPKLEPTEPLKNQCGDFIAAITTRSRPVSDCYAGYDVVRTLVAIEASMRDGGAAKEV